MKINTQIKEMIDALTYIYLYSTYACIRLHYAFKFEIRFDRELGSFRGLVRDTS